MKRVLAFQQTWDDPPGYLEEILQEYKIACHTIEVEREPLPDDLEGYDALLVMGGPQSATADDIHPYLVREKALIRQALARDMPYLGICLGGQLLANVLGATITRHRMVELGFYEVRLTEAGKADPLFQGLPGYQQVLHWHEDVFELPAGALLLATDEETPNQAFRYGRHAYGLQYHIELTPAMLDTWLNPEGYADEIIKAAGHAALERLKSQRAARYPIYREHTRRLFENFLRLGELI